MTMLPVTNFCHADMQKPTGRMDAVRFRTFLCIILLPWVLASSCQKKTTEQSRPVIEFVTDSGFIGHDTTLIAGQKFRVRVTAAGSGANVTYFSIRYDDGVKRVILDTGMSIARFSYNIEMIKTSSQVEKWTFLVMDRNRQKDSILLVLTKSSYSKWGKITTLPDVLVGAQESSDTGSFFSWAAGRAYHLDQAFLNQAGMDAVYYYGQYAATLASPAEAEAPGYYPGPEGIANWTIKNETRYDTTAVSVADFDSALNDSLLLPPMILQLESARPSTCYLGWSSHLKVLRESWD